MTDGVLFSPHRWTNGSLPEVTKAVPGVFGNVLSFLGGPHACIGYRFSLFEYGPFFLISFIPDEYHRTKVILHALISSFEFELAVPKDDVGGKRGIVTRPMLRSQKENGAQLPLLIKVALDGNEDLLA
jgi:hypothetical protein